MEVILLNADYSFLTTIHWKRAVKLIVKGKVEVIKQTEKIVSNIDKLYNIIIPKVLKLVKLIRNIYKDRVPFNKRNVLIRDNYTCQYCGERNNNMTIDHIIPISRGGKSSFNNCISACKPCNNIKNNKTPSEARMYIKRKAYTPTIMEFLRIRMKNMGIDEIINELCR